MTTQDFKDEILSKIEKARLRGADEITLRSGELQTEWGLKNKLPPICDAMKSLFRPGDRIQELPKTRASGADKAINTEGTTFEQQTDGQQYRGGRLEVVFLTKFKNRIQTKIPMITTVTSDEIEPLDEEPVIRELYVEHQVFQAFGSPNQLKRVAKVIETASGITFLAGSNSGKNEGPFSCPEVDTKIISINKQDAVKLKNLLDILSDYPKANLLIKNSKYVRHASHTNAFKIDFTDNRSPSISFNWKDNIMFVESGFLKEIENLMSGNLQ